ncbi:MAG: hypothetical protein ACRENE_28465 [Polyangiaceae bacterium]
MNPLAKHMAAGTILLGAAAAASSACVHDNSSLFIKMVLAPPSVTQGMNCTFTNDPTQMEISRGTLDIDFQAGYQATFLVGNQLVPQGDPTKPTTETSRISLTGGIVRITDTSGHEIKKFSEATSGTIDPLSGTNPGYLAVLGFPLLDVATVQGMAASLGDPTSLAPRPIVELDTYVRFYGYTLGGQYVESGEFEFPVDVCMGCLVSFSAASTNPAEALPNCNGSSASTTAGVTVPCGLEDFGIDCSLCGTNDIYCNPHPPIGTVDAGAD